MRRARFILQTSATDTDRAPLLTATLDGVPVKVGGAAESGRLRLGTLAQGRHTLVVKATDRGGNSARERREFVVDSTERFGAAALWRGARGRDVRDLQELLRARGFMSGTVTGTFDAATEAGVEAFQDHFGIAVDGRVDGATLPRSAAASSSTSPS